MRRTDWLRFAGGVVLGIALLAALAAGALCRFGSLRNVSLFLNGHNYVVEPVRIDVGSGTVGEKRTARIHIHNFGFKSIRVVGVTFSCSCASAEPLPLVINPRENREFGFVVSLRGGDGNVDQIATLLFDDDGKMRPVPIQITGKCVDAQEKARDSETKG